MEPETREQKLSRMRKYISYTAINENVAPSCDHNEGDYGCEKCKRRYDFETGFVDYACPKLLCLDWFEEEKDRNDHAFWKHGWCWTCNEEFEDPESLKQHERVSLHGERTYNCIKDCAVKFTKPSAILEHLETGRCTLPFGQMASDHWFAHLIVHSKLPEDATDEEIITIAERPTKHIILKRYSPWISDPIGAFYDEIEKGRKAARIIRTGAFEFPRLTHMKADGMQEQKRYTCLACGQNWLDKARFRVHLRSGEDDQHINYHCEHCRKGFECLSESMAHYEGKRCWDEKALDQAVSGADNDEGMAMETEDWME